MHIIALNNVILTEDFNVDVIPQEMKRGNHKIVGNFADGC